MPRDVNGNYTLPAGNPVVTNTVISSTWANTTLSDLSTAMTNSLDRTGTSSGMTGVFKAASGAIGAPGIAFGSELTMGFYRAGAGDLRLAITGVDVIRFSSTALIPVTIQAGNGAIGAPAYSWVSETNSGLYRVGAADHRYSLAGVDILKIATASFTAPAFIPTNSTVPVNGMYLSAANTVAFASNTTLRLSVSSAGNWTMVAPSSGTSITVNGVAGNIQQWTDGTRTASLFTGAGSPNVQFGTLTNHALGLFVNNSTPAFQITTGQLVQAMDQASAYQDVGWRDAPINAQAGNYGLVLADRGKMVQMNGAASTLTIPANASIAFPQGTVILVVNNTAGNISIAITTDVLVLAATATTGTRTLASNGIATLIKTFDSTHWAISGPGVT